MDKTEKKTDRTEPSKAAPKRLFKASGPTADSAASAAPEHVARAARDGKAKAAPRAKKAPRDKANEAAAPQRNDYADSVRAVRSSRVCNAAVCCAAIAAVVGFAVWAAFTDYALMSAFAALAALVPLTALLVKNLREARAVADIAYRGVYAARLTRVQQTCIRANQLRQGQIFYYACFLAVTIAEAAVLVVMSKAFASDIFLMIMAVFALGALACAAMSSLYLSARLNVKHAFCTVSSRGIITSREVIPFSAREGDVSILVKFDDYYMIRYKRAEIFGLRRNAVLIFPADGVLKNGMGEDDPASVLAGTLGLRTYKVKAASYADDRDYYTDGAVIRSSASPA